MSPSCPLHKQPLAMPPSLFTLHNRPQLAMPPSCLTESLHNPRINHCSLRTIPTVVLPKPLAGLFPVREHPLAARPAPIARADE